MNDAPEKASKADAPDALDPPAPTPRSHVALAICLAATAALLALDLGTKAWALDTLSTERVRSSVSVFRSASMSAISFSSGASPGVPTPSMTGR